MGRVPQKRKNGKKFRSLATVEHVGAEMEYCPNRHKLPYTTEFGQCTPLYCAKSGSKKKLNYKEAKDADLTLQQSLDEEAAHMKMSHTRNEKWLEFLGVPRGLKGADAEKYFDETIVELLPEAAAELKRRLRYGSSEEKMQAANKVMDSAGRGKRDSGAANVSPVVILMGNGVVQPPWSTKVVNGQVTQNALQERSAAQEVPRLAGAGENQQGDGGGVRQVQPGTDAS